MLDDSWPLLLRRSIGRMPVRGSYLTQPAPTGGPLDHLPPAAAPRAWRPAIRQVVVGAPAADERLLDRGGVRTSPDDELVTSLEATELLVLRGHRSFHTPVTGPDVQHRFAPNPSVNNRLLPPRPVARLRHHQRRSQLRSEGRERISHGAAVAPAG